jgi:hypothetical protein
MIGVGARDRSTGAPESAFRAPRPLHDDGHLRAGVSRNEACDVLWTYNSAELFQLLVLERGWSPKRYGQWVANALIAALVA